MTSILLELKWSENVVFLSGMVNIKCGKLLINLIINKIKFVNNTGFDALTEWKLGLFVSLDSKKLFIVSVSLSTF